MCADWTLAHQIRRFKPSLVSLSDASKVKELRDLIADVEHKPESAWVCQPTPGASAPHECSTLFPAQL